MLVRPLHGQLSLRGPDSGQLPASASVHSTECSALCPPLSRPSCWRRVADARAEAAHYRTGEVRRAHGTRVVASATARRVRGEDRRARARAGVRARRRTGSPARRCIPNDPGRRDVPGGWQDVQWNFLDAVAGVNAPGAWDNLIAAGRPGGAGVVVAVVDTGVAYRNYKRFRRSPDLTRRLRRGYDFVDNDRFPLDHNGHGTHVASTIAESVDNGVVADRARLRRDDHAGARARPPRRGRQRRHRRAASATPPTTARRSSTCRSSSPPRCSTRQIPDILAALRRARRKGALVVGASGNAHARAVAYPARRTTCSRSARSPSTAARPTTPTAARRSTSPRRAAALDADLPERPELPARRRAGPRHLPAHASRARCAAFGLPSGYEGTSMAAPHVSATAALVIASGVIGRRPSPAAIAAPSGADRR